MTARRTERLMNLLIMLLVQRHLVSKQRIQEILYPDDTGAAFERKFDRDKEALRELGVPIDVGSVDGFFDDEPGYRIDREAYALPPVELDPEEAAVVSLATRVWQHARLAEATTQALDKLRAAGVGVAERELELIGTRPVASEPAFEQFWDAALHRKPLTFDYGRVGETPRTRHLQTWGVLRHNGRWYAAGYDTDRRDERLFRLSRVREVLAEGRPGSYEVPADLDLRRIAAALAPPVGEQRATVWVRRGAGHGLRARALTERPLDPTEAPSTVQPAAQPADGAADSWDELELPYPGLYVLAGELLEYGADVVAVAPEELRAEVVARLEGLVDAR